MRVGDKIRSLRIQRGLEQQTLANMAGIDCGTLSKLEGGKTSRPRAETLKLIADALEVKSDYLVDDDHAETIKAVEGITEQLKRIADYLEGKNAETC